MPTPLATMVRKVATCRLMLGIIAIVAVYADPTEPGFLPGLKLRGGGFAIDPYALAVLSAHLGYSLVVYWVAHREGVSPSRLVTFTTCLDVLFGVLIIVFTEGTSSPFWPFVVFAVIAAGIDGGFRRSIIVTTVSVVSYLSLVLIAWHGDMNMFIMRPVYLATVGYLTAYLGQQRMNLEATVHRLEGVKERNRIARALHDGCVQTLGGINLTLETTRELVRRDARPQALATLAQLQASINVVVTYTSVNTNGFEKYGECLAGSRGTLITEMEQNVYLFKESEPGKARNEGACTAQFVVNADLSGSVALVEQVLQIVREAVTNVKRHANARSAWVSVRAADSEVLIRIDDDGRGFSNGAQVPWSISSLVNDAAGTVRVPADHRPGAHLEIVLPVA